MSAMAAAKMRRDTGGASGLLRAPLFAPCGGLTFPWPFFGGLLGHPHYGFALWVSKSAAPGCIAVPEAWQPGDAACQDLAVGLLGPACRHRRRSILFYL